MKLAAIGEFGFIGRFSPPFLQGLGENVGIGDDCAVIPWGGDLSLVVTTDLLIEDIHFLRAKISPEDLGHKSLAVNLSDIGAMGATPLCAFLSLGIPADLDVEWLDGFFLGFRRLADSWRVQLLGGDTTRSPGPLVVNVAVLGQGLTDKLKYRSSARKEDLIVVTGFLGDSGGGLKILLEGLPGDGDADYLVRSHNRPEPHLAEGAWLAAQEGVHALIDVSDGIDSDLKRIMERSRCGCLVNLEDLPVSPALGRAAARYQWALPELAACGGEDYCLLATVAKEDYPALEAGFKRRFNKPLATIGSIIEPEEGLRYLSRGQPVALSRAGFDHFSSRER